MQECYVVTLQCSANHSKYTPMQKCQWRVCYFSLEWN